MDKLTKETTEKTNYCHGCFGAANNDCLECPKFKNEKAEGEKHDIS